VGVKGGVGLERVWRPTNKGWNKNENGVWFGTVWCDETTKI